MIKLVILAAVFVAAVAVEKSLELPKARITLRARTKNAASSDFLVVVDAFDVTGAPADTTAPAVTITSPTSGASVSGTVTVRADATDDVNVVAVQFFVDGSPLAARISRPRL